MMTPIAAAAARDEEGREGHPVDPGRYRTVRAFSETLCEPLAIEDYVVQTAPFISPAKWHLAHTSWFFETFVLPVAVDGYTPYHPAFRYLFNSYYNTVGEQYPRPERGLLSRPTVEEVYRYRRHVDERMDALLAGSDDPQASWRPLLEIGLHHEQQHQELLLTDIKHVLAHNPLRPVYRERPRPPHRAVSALSWLAYPDGIREVGKAGPGFAYDNETPRHRVFLQAFALASRLVTCAEYMAFMADGGYDRPELWLSDGWYERQSRRWQAPLYWEAGEHGWEVMTLAGKRPVEESEPVCHVSYYEADAYARWADARLPTEAEWEAAAVGAAITGNFVESGVLHPGPEEPGDAGPGNGRQGPAQMFGDVWEWTSSPYMAYPGYHPPTAALGEYNGKFMCNQMVLRGGSCATSRSHIRVTYRNFFHPEERWQFMGIRLAQDA